MKVHCDAYRCRHNSAGVCQTGCIALRLTGEKVICMDYSIRTDNK